MDEDDLVAKYIEYISSNADPKEKLDLYEQSLGIMYDLVRKKPDVAWNIIKKIVDKTDDEWVLTMVGCQELEDLLEYNFENYVEKAERIAKCDRKFAFALSCVSLEGPRAQRLDRLIAELKINRV